MSKSDRSISEGDDARLRVVLADAFDKAATTCGTKEHAAQQIIIDLQLAGFKIRAK